MECSLLFVFTYRSIWARHIYWSSQTLHRTPARRWGKSPDKPYPRWSRTLYTYIHVNTCFMNYVGLMYWDYGIGLRVLCMRLMTSSYTNFAVEACEAIGWTQTLVGCVQSRWAFEATATILTRIIVAGSNLYRKYTDKPISENINTIAMHDIDTTMHYVFNQTCMSASACHLFHIVRLCSSHYRCMLGWFR